MHCCLTLAHAREAGTVVPLVFALYQRQVANAERPKRHYYNFWFFCIFWIGQCSRMSMIVRFCSGGGCAVYGRAIRYAGNRCRAAAIAGFATQRSQHFLFKPTVSHKNCGRCVAKPAITLRPKIALCVPRRIGRKWHAPGDTKTKPLPSADPKNTEESII